MRRNAERMDELLKQDVKNGRDAKQRVFAAWFTAGFDFGEIAWRYLGGRGEGTLRETAFLAPDTDRALSVEQALRLAATEIVARY